VYTGSPDTGYLKQTKKQYIVWSLVLAAGIDAVYCYFMCVVITYKGRMNKPDEEEKMEEEKKDEEKKDEEKKDEEKKDEEKKDEEMEPMMEEMEPMMEEPMMEEPMMEDPPMEWNHQRSYWSSNNKNHYLGVTSIFSDLHPYKRVTEQEHRHKIWNPPLILDQASRIYIRYISYIFQIQHYELNRYYLRT